jgi:hypothetical protein
MGSLYQGVCYPDAATVQQAACSASSLKWGTGSEYITVDCVESIGSVMVMSKCTDGQTCTTFQQPYPAFPECEFSGGTDLALSWLYAVLPVLAVLWGLKKLAGLFATNPKEEA